MARMRELRGQGLSYLKISLLGTERRGPTFQTGGPWQAASIRSVLLSVEKVAVA